MFVLCGSLKYNACTRDAHRQSCGPFDLANPPNEPYDGEYDPERDYQDEYKY